MKKTDKQEKNIHIERIVENMDLNSRETIKLLRDCIAIELRRMEGMPHSKSPEMLNKIQLYKTLFHDVLKVENAEIILQKNQTGDLAEFSKYMLSTPPKDILEKYTNLTKQSMLDSGTYTDEKFNHFKNAFYAELKGTTYLQEPEEETSIYLTPDMEENLNTLNELFHTNQPHTMSPEKFKTFSKQFRDIVKHLGKSKFQQYFDTKHQTVSDMQISYEPSEEAQKVYQINLSLLDEKEQETQRIFKEQIPAFPELATYFQNLCYAYLEADTYSNETLPDTVSIKKQMNTFSKCYQKLEQMLNLKMNISSDNTIIFSYETNRIPQKKSENIAAYTVLDEEEKMI